MMAFQFLPLSAANNFLRLFLVSMFGEKFRHLFLLLGSAHPGCQGLPCEQMAFAGFIFFPPFHLNQTFPPFGVTTFDISDAFPRMSVVDQSFRRLLVGHVHIK